MILKCRVLTLYFLYISILHFCISLFLHLWFLYFCIFKLFRFLYFIFEFCISRFLYFPFWVPFSSHFAILFYWICYAFSPSLWSVAWVGWWAHWESPLYVVHWYYKFKIDMKVSINFMFYTKLVAFFCIRLLKTTVFKISFCTFHLSIQESW